MYYGERGGKYSTFATAQNLVNRLLSTEEPKNLGFDGIVSRRLVVFNLGFNDVVLGLLLVVVGVR